MYPDWPSTLTMNHNGFPFSTCPSRKHMVVTSVLACRWCTVPVSLDGLEYVVANPLVTPITDCDSAASAVPPRAPKAPGASGVHRSTDRPVDSIRLIGGHHGRPAPGNGDAVQQRDPVPEGGSRPADVAVIGSGEKSKPTKVLWENAVASTVRWWPLPQATSRKSSADSASTGPAHRDAPRAART